MVPAWPMGYERALRVPDIGGGRKEGAKGVVLVDLGGELLVATKGDNMI